MAMGWANQAGLGGAYSKVGRKKEERGAASWHSVFSGRTSEADRRTGVAVSIRIVRIERSTEADRKGHVFASLSPPDQEFTGTVPTRTIPDLVTRNDCLGGQCSQ